MGFSSIEWWVDSLVDEIHDDRSQRGARRIRLGEGIFNTKDLVDGNMNPIAGD